MLSEKKVAGNYFVLVTRVVIDLMHNITRYKMIDFAQSWMVLLLGLSYIGLEDVNDLYIG